MAGPPPSVERLQRDILNLDTAIRGRIDELPTNCRSDKDLYSTTRDLRGQLQEMKMKIDELVKLKPTIAKIVLEGEHFEQLIVEFRNSMDWNKNALALAATKVRQQLEKDAREQLFARDTPSSGDGLRHRTTDMKSSEADAARATERLSSLVSKMGERANFAEEHMAGLVESSSLLSRAGTEFTDQATHIQTGHKLLSKFERRELTDKVLVLLALCFYLVTIYYILHKRVLSRFPDVFYYLLLF
ncbi:unnamed protein product, partial [Mesorhabditis spiculigera]